MKEDPTIDREWPAERTTGGTEQSDSGRVRPYRDSREHVVDELRRIDVLLRGRVATWRAETGGSADEFSGYYISDERIDQLLQLPGEGHDRRDANVFGDIGEEQRQHAERLAARIAARVEATRESGTELRFAQLVDRFGLSADEQDIFLMAVAPEFDAKYETVYGYLNDDLTRKRPTVDLLIRTLVGSTADCLAARRLFARTAPLRRNALVRAAGGEATALPSRPVLADERVVDYLLGSDALDGVLSEFVTAVEPETTHADRRFDPAVESRLERLRKGDSDGERATTVGRSEPPMAYFHGSYGSGKQRAVEALCAERDRPLVRADARGLAACCGDAAGLREAVDRLLREAELREADVAVENLDTGGNEKDDDRGTEAEGLLRALDEFDGWVFVSGEEPPPANWRAAVEDHAFVAVEFPIPSYERRRELWRTVDGLPEDVDVADLAGKFRLTGGQIADAVETARSLTYGEELTAESVYAGCRMQSRETLGSLGSVVEPAYGWDDIVLPADERAHLREVAAHIKHQGRVYADWGFERKFSLGNGVIALFTGPSGTGKTMAAEIIANDAGLDLYKIDLSNVVSKYIGETEKNLGEVFDEAENSDAILFFDEADALFGERSEVSDAHDRYANIEVNYLLQRVEEHDGAVIMTTNFKGNIDDAFLRRIHMSVDFPLPDEDARERIWRGVFPAETPVGELDYEFLSEFELTGGNIKNVALTAAFLAASGERTEVREGMYWAEAETVRRLVAETDESDVGDEENLDSLDRVGMEHVVRAMRREFQKTGKLVKDETFGVYSNLIGEKQ